MEIHCKNYGEKKYSIGRDIHDFAQILQLPGNDSTINKNFLFWLTKNWMQIRSIIASHDSRYKYYDLTEHNTHRTTTEN